MSAVTEQELAHWEPLVKHLARYYASNPQTYEDLCQEGRIAVLKAIPKVDSRKGKASTYLTHRVRGAMLHYLRDQTAIIRLPAWRQERGESPARVVSFEAFNRQDGESALGHAGFEEGVLDQLELSEILEKANLSPRQAEALRARVTEERPMKWIETKSRLPVAREKLRAARKKVRARLRAA